MVDAQSTANNARVSRDLAAQIGGLAVLLHHAMIGCRYDEANDCYELDFAACVDHETSARVLVSRGVTLPAANVHVAAPRSEDADSLREALDEASALIASDERDLEGWVPLTDALAQARLQGQRAAIGWLRTRLEAANVRVGDAGLAHFPKGIGVSGVTNRLCAVCGESWPCRAALAPTDTEAGR